jgi:hypothetical protein
MKKTIDTKKLLFENMSKLNPDFKPKEVLSESKQEVISEDKKWIQKAVDPEHKGYCTPMTKPTCTPKRKALAKRFKKGIEDESVVNEVQLNTDKYETLSSALDAVREKVAERGYTVDEEAIWEQFGTGGIGYGQKKVNIVIPLLKNGVPDKNRSVTVSIIRLENGLYEMISHIN